MDLQRMQATFWMLLFGFLIFVPGSTLNAIEETTAEAEAVSTATTSLATLRNTARTTATEEPSKTPSLFKDAINDKTFPKTQSTTPTATTLSSAEVPAAAAATATATPTTTTTKTTTSSLAGKATNVSFSIATKASLNPSRNAKDTATRATTATKLTTAATPVLAAVTTTTTTTREQVTKAEQLVGRLKPITAKSVQTPNNSDNRFINNTNNNSVSDNRGVSSVGNISEQSGNIADAAALENYTQITKKQQQHIKQQHQQARPLQRPNIYYDYRHEQQYQQQQQETQLRQQFTRHVQRANASAAATAAEAVTTTPSTTAAHNVTAPTTVAGATLDSNLIIADKNIKENELETDSADKSNSKATLATSFEAFSGPTTILPVSATVLLSSFSSSSSTAIPATVTPLPTTTTTTTIKTTTRRPIPTTTLKPPPVIDDYRTITSQAGTHAYLPCNVKQLVKKPISWLRVRDGHILTVDQTTFIADQRFQSIYTPNPERWSLQIKYVQPKDAGTYECQVSTEPKASAIVYLRIVEPKTELIGESSRHVKAGSQVKLRCIISQALEPPLFINWFYNQKQIYLHNRKGWRTEIERIDLPPETPATTTTTGTTGGGGTAATAAMERRGALEMASSLPGSDGGSATALVSAITATTMLAATTTTKHTTTTSMATTTTTMAAAEVKQITTASLIIPAVEKLDSGNYTCSPSNSAPRTVVLHVLNGEYSASAIRSGVSGNHQHSMMMTTMLRMIAGNRTTHQRYICWRSAATILALLWIVKFLVARNLWHFNRDRNKNNKQNYHRNRDANIEATQFVGNREKNGNTGSSSSRSNSTISTALAEDKT